MKDEARTWLNYAEEECDLLNSIYLPTKYPLGNALPDLIPDKNIRKEIMEITKRVFQEIKKQIPG